MSLPITTHFDSSAITVVAQVEGMLHTSLFQFSRDVDTDQAMLRREPRRERVESEADPSEIRNSQLFNDPSATVVLETSDHMVYKIHDYFLKANR